MAMRFSVAFDKPLTFPDFDKRALKNAHREVGRELQKRARLLVSRKGLSKPGENPSRVTGLLRRNIRYRVSRSGFSVALFNDPKKMPEFYPAFVYYGHRGPGTDKGLGVDGKKQHGRKRIGTKVAAPRNNWIVQATEDYGYAKYGVVMRKVFDEAIKPGVISK